MCKFCGCMWKASAMHVKIKSAVPITKRINRLLKKHKKFPSAIKPKEQRLIEAYHKNGIKTVSCVALFVFPPTMTGKYRNSLNLVNF